MPVPRPWSWFIPLVFGLLSCSPPHGTEVPEYDLLPFARLSASATRLPDGQMFVREAEDGVQTVRDDFPDTAWKIPVGEDASLEIDFLPLVGARVVPLRIGASWPDGVPDKVTIELSGVCGGKPFQSIPWNDPASPVVMDEWYAGCVTLRFVSSKPVSMSDLHIFSRRRIGVSFPSMSSFPKSDRRFGESGIVEGFYGRPWSWLEREHMVMSLAVAGMDLYLYAPKNDPYHRAKWREAYPQEFMERFSVLARTAKDLRVLLVFGVSPFIDLDFTKDADYQTLRSKVGQMIEAGATGVAVLADDIEFEASVEIDEDLGKRHVELTNRLRNDVIAASKDVLFWFCPTAYSDARANQWPGYLETVKGLDPAIRVLWTGPGTSSLVMKASDMDRFQAATGRKPVIWENFWANDGGDEFLGRILLAAYTGRSPDLPGAVIGIAPNPMIQGALDRLALGMFVAWIKDPAGADREAQVSSAVALEQAFAFGRNRATEGDEAVLRFAIEIFDGNMQVVPGWPALTEAVDAVKAGLAGGKDPAPAAQVLARMLARMATSGAEARHSGLDPDLVDDLSAPLDRVRLDGEWGLAALDLLAARLGGKDAIPALAGLAKAEAAAGQSRFVFSPGVVQGLADAIKAFPGPGAGFEAPGATGDSISCDAGKTVDWMPFEAGAEVAVFGLTGAVVEQGEILWTPPHGGRYTAIAVASTKNGWAWRSEEFVCE